VRFTKSDILEGFERQDRSYRLAIISSHWLQGGQQYKPSASDEARGLWMKACDKWISYSDLADLLEQDPARIAVSSDFVLNQLHALIRAPFELLANYCEDYDKVVPDANLVSDFHATDWYEFARIVHNTVSHNFCFHFSKNDRNRLPITWHGISLTENLDGKLMTCEFLWHKLGYELFLEMRAFAEVLPEPPIGASRL
jgi:hypothetical protein